MHFKIQNQLEDICNSIDKKVRGPDSGHENGKIERTQEISRTDGILGMRRELKIMTNY